MKKHLHIVVLQLHLVARRHLCGIELCVLSTNFGLFLPSASVVTVVFTAATATAIV